MTSMWDLNGDGSVSPADVDYACQLVHQNAESIDLNRDGKIDVADVVFYVEQMAWHLTR